MYLLYLHNKDKYCATMARCGMCDTPFYSEDRRNCDTCTAVLNVSFIGDESAPSPSVPEEQFPPSGLSLHEECEICLHTAYPIAFLACCGNQLCLRCIRMTVAIGIGDVLCPYCKASLMTTVIKINKETDANDGRWREYTDEEECDFHAKVARQILAGVVLDPREYTDDETENREYYDQLAIQIRTGAELDPSEDPYHAQLALQILAGVELDPPEDPAYFIVDQC